MANGTYSVEDHLLGPTFRRQAGSIFAPEYGDEGGGLYNVERENFGFSDDAYENLINLIEAGYLAGEPLEQAYETAQPGYQFRYEHDAPKRWNNQKVKFEGLDPDDFQTMDYYYTELGQLAEAGDLPDVVVKTPRSQRGKTYSTSPYQNLHAPVLHGNTNYAAQGRYVEDYADYLSKKKAKTSTDVKHVAGGEGLLPGVNWLGTTGQFAPTGAFEELFEVADGAPSLSHLYTYNPQIAMEDGILINPPSIFNEQSILGGLERLGMEDATPGMVRATPLSNLRALDPSAYTQFLQGRRRPLIEQLIGSIGAARGMGSGFAGYGKRGQAEETLKRKFGQNVGSIYSDIDSRRASAMNKLFSDLGELENLIANYRNEAV